MIKNILWLSVFWIAPLQVYLLLNQTKFKKNIVLGVTLPSQARENPDVLNELARFKRREIAGCLFLLALIVPCLLISNTETMMAFWGTWIDLCIILPYIPLILSHQKLMEIKEKNDWVQAQRQVIVDTRALPDDRWVSPWVFVPAVLACLVPGLYDHDFWILSAIMALLCAGMAFGYRYLYRNKAEMVDSNIELTRALTQIRKYNWSKIWILMTYLMACVSLCMTLSFQYPKAALLLMIAITVIMVVLSIRIEMRMRTIQERLTKDSGTDWYVDDDAHWIGGFLYYNPDDSRLIINERIGMNSTINMARPAGKIFMGFTILLLAALPFFGILFGSGPIDIQVNNDVIVAKEGWTTYTIETEDIEEITVLDTLPEGMVRIMGTGMDTLLKGDFSCTEYGKMKVLLDPTQGPFVLIRTKEGRLYLLGTRDNKMTQSLSSLNGSS